MTKVIHFLTSGSIADFRCKGTIRACGGLILCCLVKSTAACNTFVGVTVTSGITETGRPTFGSCQVGMMVGIQPT
jgi:hypothetical protein